MHAAIARSNGSNMDVSWMCTSGERTSSPELDCYAVAEVVVVAMFVVVEPSSADEHWL